MDVEPKSLHPPLQISRLEPENNKFPLKVSVFKGLFSGQARELSVGVIWEWLDVYHFHQSNPENLQVQIQDSASCLLEGILLMMATRNPAFTS